jgi:hypothetical protein
MGLFDFRIPADSALLLGTHALEQVSYTVEEEVWDRKACREFVAGVGFTPARNVIG